jgi:hypothetical protein
LTKTGRARGSPLHVLFVCSQNRLRSPTAEQVFARRPDWEVDSAGTNHDAEQPLGAELVDWAASGSSAWTFQTITPSWSRHSSRCWKPKSGGCCHKGAIPSPSAGLPFARLLM